MNFFKDKWYSFSIIVLLLAAFSWASAETPVPQSESGIEGVISVGPTHGGPMRVGVSDSAPLAKTEFVVKQEDRPITSFTTDDQGRFRISLPPGQYTVALKERKGGIGHYGPFTADVVAGQMKKVEWRCDNGMR